jgi:hypothetical protein
VVTVWSIHKAGELARLELYLDFATQAAGERRTDLARDVALETVGHVTMEDPRLHLLLGKLAVLLKDKALRRDAEAFLSFLNVERYQDRLREPV